MEWDASGQEFDEPLTDDAVIAFIANDLPYMNEAQLAELLANLFFAGESVVSDAIAPLARQELSRRRFIEMVEMIAAAA